MIDFNPEDIELEEFDAAEFLNTPEAIVAYLTSAMKANDIEHFRNVLKALSRVKI